MLGARSDGSVVRGRAKSWVLVALFCSAGCGAPAFPSELFTISAPHADYPVMLSRTGPSGGKASGKRGARPLAAESGTRASVQQSSYYVGNGHVTITQTNAARSEMSASEKLMAQVRRSDKWVQLEAAVFTATDFSTYGASSSERMLLLDATAHD